MPDEPLTIRAFQSLIRDRYYATDSARGPEATFLYVAEEFGELARALAKNRPGRTPSPGERQNLEEEFADLIAWVTTMANLTGVDLERALEKYTDPGRVEGVKT